MRYHSDPTAARALGGINREFARLEKKAKRLCEQYCSGKITRETLDNAQRQFTGIYRHVLTHALEQAKKQNPPGDAPGGFYAGKSFAYALLL